MAPVRRARYGRSAETRSRPARATAAAHAWPVETRSFLPRPLRASAASGAEAVWDRCEARLTSTISYDAGHGRVRARVKCDWRPARTAADSSSRHVKPREKKAENLRVGQESGCSIRQLFRRAFRSPERWLGRAAR